MKNIVKIIVLLVALAINTAVFGAHVNQTTAQTMATTVATKGDNHLKSASVLSLVYAKENAFYVFGNETSFVIVAADDRVTPILGYSNEGPFILPNSKDSTGNNFWGMLNSYQKQIEYVVDNNIAATSTIAAQWENIKSGNVLKSANIAVTPLLTTTWSQGWPYNALCPSDANGPGGHVWAGCVATAMAQILKYHNYPNQGLGSYGYQSGTYPTTTADFGATTYNWKNMPNSISTPNDDVATLIYQAAVSVRSMWGPGNTGVSYLNGEDPMTRAFVNYFTCAFAPLQYVSKSSYNDTDWNTLLQNELLNNRPIYYRGDGVGSHSWVCDGVDATNMYHFNWGWGGDNDGYFSLTAIVPGNNNFTNNQDAIIGIQPNDGSTLVANTSWSGNINTLTSIAVPDALTLTVNAGAVLKFAQNTKLQVWGRVLSTGTPDKYATFTAIDTAAGWLGIKFDNNYMNFEVMADNASSKFLYSQIEYSKMCGIYAYRSPEIIIDHCKINNNSSNDSGGGIYIVYGPIQITNSEFFQNIASQYGGGFEVGGNDSSSALITGNSIYQNTAGVGGGFVLSHTGKFSNNSVHHNQAVRGAGGALIGGVGINDISVINNIFSNNSTLLSNGQGGGLYLDNCSANIINNVIVNNTAIAGAALVMANGSSPLIVNTTIAKNLSQSLSSIALTYNSSPIFKNTIIYGNSNGNGKEFYFKTGSPSISYCVLEGGLNAIDGSGTNYTNNMDTNPLFVAPSTGAGSGYDGMTANWQLSSASPCINTGDISGVSTLLPTTDLAGAPRINGIIDMGAYEYQISLLPVSVTIVASADSVGSGSSVTFTATPVNGGNAPLYQWKRNGSNVGDNTATYSYLPVDGDVISCVLISNLSNTTGSPATSNTITMIVTLTDVSPMVTFNEISIYPNPCHGVFSIKSSEELSKVILLDQLGKVISETISPDLGFRYDYSSLSKGIYLVCIVSKKDRVVQKIIFN